MVCRLGSFYLTGEKYMNLETDVTKICDDIIKIFKKLDATPEETIGTLKMLITTLELGQLLIEKRMKIMIDHKTEIKELSEKLEAVNAKVIGMYEESDLTISEIHICLSILYYTSANAIAQLQAEEDEKAIKQEAEKPPAQNVAPTGIESEEVVRKE